jgi:hypothetical protein
MKPIIFAVFLFSVSLNARAQMQPDSVPTTQGWIEANSGTIATVGISSFPSLDTAWASGLWTHGSQLLNWEPTPPSWPQGGTWMLTMSYGFVNGNNIYRTTDGGITWDTLPPTPKYTSGLYVVSPSEAFSIGSSYIGRTLDSGKSWDEQEVNAALVSDISFANGQVGFAADAESHKNLLKTTDSGSTWDTVDTRFGAFPNPVGSVFAINQSVVLVSGAGMISRSTNGGQSWDSVYSSAGTLCFKGKYGFAVGLGCILESNDSGLTWNREAIPTTADLYTIVMYDSVHAIASGENGTILVTSNGGLSWVSENNTAPDSLVVQTFPNPASSTIQFSYTLNKGEHMTVTILNTVGAVVETPINYAWQAGPETVQIDVGNLASGTYLFSLSCEDYSTSGSFTVLH